MYSELQGYIMGTVDSFIEYKYTAHLKWQPAARNMPLHLYFDIPFASLIILITMYMQLSFGQEKAIINHRETELVYHEYYDMDVTSIVMILN